MTGLADSAIDRAVAAYRDAFGALPDRIAYAPGRVNLIGEHTDYNDGFVFPCAIDRGTAVAIGTASDGLIDVVSADYGERDCFNPASPFATAPGWRAHVRAVAAVFRARAITVAGGKLAIAGNVPQGAGLSSSASLGVALGAALDAAGTLDPTQLARVAQAAENDFVGCACGIMDQLAAARGKVGAALMIDCRSLAVTPVELPADMAVLIIHSGISRGLVDSAYNQRRASCEAVAAHFGIAALRDLDGPTLASARADLDPVAFRRACHVVTENARTLAMPAALAASDWPTIGRLMAESHASMRDDFDISLPAIDRLVDAVSAATGGIGGVRMTGGGFGGCIVALTRHDLVPRLREAAITHFAAIGQAPGLIHACRPSAGLTITSASDLHSQ